MGATLKPVEPQDTYMQMSPTPPPPPPPVSVTPDPGDTYIEMNLPPPCSPSDETYEQMGTNTLAPPHTYVNRHVYQNVAPTVQQPPCIDPVTTQKLIENVAQLMATVRKQDTEILCLKRTVKELKMTVERLESIAGQDEYAYD